MRVPAVVSSDAAAFFAHLKKKSRPLLRAAVDAKALKRGASLEEVSRLHDEVDMQDWRDMLKRSQELWLKLRKRLNQRGPLLRSHDARGAPGGELRDAPREARGPEAAPHSHERHRLAGADRELYEVEEQLVSKKIAERLPVSLAAKSATLAALERVEKARKELDEASRELLIALKLKPIRARSPSCLTASGGAQRRPGGASGGAARS